MEQVLFKSFLFTEFLAVVGLFDPIFQLVFQRVETSC